MNQKIIAACFLQFGSLLEKQVLPELFKKLREHHLIQLYVETVVIYCYRWSTWLNPSFGETHYRLGRVFQKQQKWQEAATAFEQAT
ncbi:MAG: tetratricopeptide repeat protein [Symploca sp. SIO2C1]|nr:tetratricopeptide repeat protein [Symploca sp. SIO2C1]